MHTIEFFSPQYNYQDIVWGKYVLFLYGFNLIIFWPLMYIGYPNILGTMQFLNPGCDTALDNSEMAICKCLHFRTLAGDLFPIGENTASIPVGLKGKVPCMHVLCRLNGVSSHGD